MSLIVSFSPWIIDLRSFLRRFSPILFRTFSGSRGTGFGGGFGLYISGAQGGAGSAFAHFGHSGLPYLSSQAWPHQMHSRRPPRGWIGADTGRFDCDIAFAHISVGRGLACDFRTGSAGAEAGRTSEPSAAGTFL